MGHLSGNYQKINVPGCFQSVPPWDIHPRYFEKVCKNLLSTLFHIMSEKVLLLELAVIVIRNELGLFMQRYSALIVFPCLSWEMIHIGVPLCCLGLLFVGSSVGCLLPL